MLFQLDAPRRVIRKYVNSLSKTDVRKFLDGEKEIIVRIPAAGWRTGILQLKLNERK